MRDANIKQLRNGIAYHPELDGLRALAILGVFFFHTKLAWFPHLETDGGLLGVDLFFVLSGFLITSLLVQEHATTGRLHRARFYGRRFLRLVPALALALVLGAVIAHFFGNGPDSLPYPRAAAAALLFVGNWFGSSLGLLAHTWALGVEEQYYLVWPLVLGVALSRGVRLHRVAASVAGMAILVAAMRGSMARSAPGLPVGDPRSVLRIDGVLLGSALALLLASSQRERLVQLLRDRTLATAALVCAAAIAAWAARPDLRTYDSILAMDACFVLVVGHAFTNKQSAVSRALRSQPLVAIGKISYGLFLFHWPLFVLMGHLFGRSLIAAVAGWSSAFLLAILSYAIVERPVLKLKDRLRSRTAETSQPARHAGHKSARRKRTRRPARRMAAADAAL